MFVYDDVAYPTPIVPEMNPSRIRAACLLSDFGAPDIAGAAVLEVGCGDGYNLLAMAAATPAALHVGFDLSASAIARGQRVLDRSGLKNAELAQGDITTWSRPAQKFDYILCHGVHSWVPEGVQEALLGLISAHLAPGGVAYISHDVLPAAAPKWEIKRFLHRATAALGAPDSRLAAAREILADLGRGQRLQSRLKPQLDAVLGELPSYDDGYFFHDWLAESYRPVSMLEMADQSARHGLTPIGEAGLVDLYDHGRRADVNRLAARIGDTYADRAYTRDIMGGLRMFRRTLLVREDASPGRPAGLGDLRIALASTPEPAPAVTAGATVYKGLDGAYFTPADASEARVMALLQRAAPGEVSYSDLLPAVGDADILRRIVTQICAVPVAVAYASEAPYVRSPGDRPLASPLVRVMLDAVEFGPTLRLNRLVSKQGATRTFLSLCDGARTRDDLRREMSASLGRDITQDQIEAVLADLAARQVFIA